MGIKEIKSVILERTPKTKLLITSPLFLLLKGLVSHISLEITILPNYRIGINFFVSSFLKPQGIIYLTLGKITIVSLNPGVNMIQSVFSIFSL